MPVRKNNKILFLINCLGVGGAERSFVRQANSLADKGIEVWLGVLAGEKNSPLVTDDLRAAVNLVDFKAQGLGDFRAWWRLWQFVRQGKITVVYATLDRAMIWARALKILRPGLRVVIRESGMASRKTQKGRWLDKILNWRVDAVVAVSLEVRDSLLEYQPKLRARLFVVPNGVKPVWPLESLADQRRGRAQLTILNVGSMANPNKGQAGLLEAAARLRRQHPEWKFLVVFVGDGAERKKLESLAQSLDLSRLVIFTGLLAPKAVVEQYVQADIFVLNSASEGFPNAVLEAMSYALPVLARPVGGISELILDRETGLLIATDSLEVLLERLLADESLRGRLGAAAYARVSGLFSVEAEIQKLLPILFP